MRKESFENILLMDEHVLEKTLRDMHEEDKKHLYGKLIMRTANGFSIDKGGEWTEPIALESLIKMFTERKMFWLNNFEKISKYVMYKERNMNVEPKSKVTIEEVEKGLNDLPIGSAKIMFGRIVHRNNKGYRVENDNGGWTRRRNVEESAAYLLNRSDEKPFKGDVKRDVWYEGKLTKGSLLGNNRTIVRPVNLKVIDDTLVIYDTNNDKISIISLKEARECSCVAPMRMDGKLKISSYDEVERKVKENLMKI